MAGLRLWLVVAALLAGGLLAACNGGDEDGDDEGAAEQPAATTAVEGEEAEEDEAAGDLSEELRALAERFGVQEVKITYSISGTTDDAADEGSMTLYWKPPDWRIDFEFEGAVGSLIQSGDTGYVCSELGGEGQCLESPVAAGAPLPFLSFFTEPDAFSELIAEAVTGLDIDRSQRSIAGEDASCFSVRGTIEGEQGSAEYCFSSDGILLLLRAGGSGPEGSGEFALEATSVEDSVSDEDLQPPYEVIEIPGAP